MVSGVANKNAAACVKRAFDLGRNFSDTANVYGRGATASFLGNVLSKRSRDSYILATKVHFPVSARDKGLLVHNQVNAACNSIKLRETNRKLASTMSKTVAAPKPTSHRQQGMSVWCFDAALMRCPDHLPSALRIKKLLGSVNCQISPHTDMIGRP